MSSLKKIEELEGKLEKAFADLECLDLVFLENEERRSAVYGRLKTNLFDLKKTLSDEKKDLIRENEERYKRITQPTY